MALNRIGKDMMDQDFVKEVEDIAKKLPEVYIDSLGAKGDGITNDTIAFQKAADIINAASGGKIVLSNKTYIVGKQTLAGANNKGNSYIPENILYIHDCTKPVVIEGNGAKIKSDSNLKLGSFDPVTGAVYTPTLPFTNINYRADAYTMLDIKANSSVILRDLDLDGNIEGIILGGEWGDYGYQCKATGLKLTSNKNVITSNVKSHHHGLDGIAIGGTMLETDEKRPHLLINVECEYNARQGLSWVGGIGLTGINCKFNHTGKVRFSSAPGAGLDIESENSVDREGFFLNCEMINNTGSGMVSYSGDGGYTTFKRCTFWGTTGTAISPNKPGIVFEDCKIYGTISNVYGSDNPLKATKFIRCEIEDKNHPLYGVRITPYMIDINAHNALFEGCTLINNYQKLISTQDSATIEIFKDCKFIFKYSGLADKNSQAVFYGSRFENVTFSDAYATPPLTAYYIDAPGNTAQIVGNVVVDGAWTNWGSWSTGAGGMKGDIGSQINKPQKFLSIHKRLYNSTFYGSLLIGSSNVMPTTGTYTKGDEIINDNPTELGTTGSKYILTGWKRLTTGSTHVLNTDWFEMRNLTGN
jgi:hypothetical protein